MTVERVKLKNKTGDWGILRVQVHYAPKKKGKPTTVRSMYPGYEHHSRYKQIESWNLISGLNGNSADAFINLSGFHSVTASVAFISDMIWSKKKLAFHSSNMTFIFALH